MWIVRGVLIIAVFFTGCVSMSTHQKELRQARNEELSRAEHLASEVKDCGIDAKDMVFLIRMRREQVGQ